ncbi:hypothetical protein BZM26_24110 [Paraburkholderia strydomiana]|nr:hypothetical protein BZM26_24110 [Paraburkholderia strydomiana]
MWLCKFALASDSFPGGEARFLRVQCDIKIAAPCGHADTIALPQSFGAARSTVANEEVRSHFF